MVVDAGGLVVSEDSLLNGTGTVSIATTVRGTLAPGNSPGVLGFAGNLRMAPGSSLAIDIDGAEAGTGAGFHDQVVVGAGGTFTAGGTLRPTLRGITGEATNAYEARLTQSLRIVEAEGGVLGSFSGMAQPVGGLPAGARMDALYGARDVTLWVTPKSYRDLAAHGVRLRPNQARVGGALDTLRGEAGLRVSEPVTHELRTLFRIVPSGLATAMNRLGGAVYGDALQTSVGANRAFGDAVLGQSANRISVASADGRFVSWASGFGGNSRIGGDGNTGYRASGGGFAAGTDVRLGAGLRLGGAIGHGGASVSSRDTAASARVNTTHAAVYGQYELGRYEVAGQLGLNFAEAKATRHLGAFGTTARGDASGTGFGAGLEAKATYGLGGFRFQPVLGLRLDTASRGGLTETGAGALSLSVADGDVSSVRATAGIRADRTFALAEGWSLTPSLRVRYSHELGDDGLSTSAAFSGNGLARFQQATARPGRSGGDASVGFDLRMPSGVSAFANYTAEARGNLSGHAATGGIRYSW
jgi:outer membrane autotransporter protein